MPITSNFTIVEHPANYRHITEGNIKKLGQLTVNNPLFRALLVSKESRDHQLSNDSITDAKIYFAVDDKNHHFLNHFRLSWLKIKRLGCTLQGLCTDLKNKLNETAKPATLDSNQRVLHDGIKNCAETLRQVVVGPDESLPKDNECHMRTALLTDVLSRQLGMIKASGNDDAGQQITHTLNWIDAVLASDCLTGIGIGGKLKAEKKDYETRPQTRLAAAREPFIRINPDHFSAGIPDIPIPPSDLPKFSDLNTALATIRRQLQALQVEMALDHCATTATTQVSNAKSMISQLDTIKGGPLKLTKDSNLSKTLYAAASIGQQRDTSLAAKITEVKANLADFKTWSENFKTASNTLVNLCSGVIQSHETDAARSDWIERLQAWHEQYKQLRIPNAAGCLDMESVEFSKLINELSAPNKSRADWLSHAFTAISTLGCRLSGDTLDKSQSIRIEEKYKGFFRNTIDEDAFTKQLTDQYHVLSARIEASRDSVGENMAQIGVINLCDATSFMLKHLEQNGSQPTDDIKIIRESMKDALAITQEIGAPTTTQTRNTSALVEKVDSALKHLIDFFDVNIFSAHRSEIRDIYTHHLSAYAYFDHPKTQTIIDNVISILKNPNFQENISAHIQSHGLTVAQLEKQQPPIRRPLLSLVV
ncbi:hypothetical protein D3C77_97840 [compost metagenome]